MLLVCFFFFLLFLEGLEVQAGQCGGVGGGEGWQEGGPEEGYLEGAEDEIGDIGVGEAASEGQPDCMRKVCLNGQGGTAGNVWGPSSSSLPM